MIHKVSIKRTLLLNNNFHRVLLSQTLFLTNILTTTEMIYRRQTAPEESGQNNFSWHVPLERDLRQRPLGYLTPY